MRVPTILAMGLATTLLSASLAAQEPAPQPQPAPAAAAAAPAPTAAELGLFIYPAKEQTKDQQTKDEQECYAWAGEQSKVDPAGPKANSDSAAKRRPPAPRPTRPRRGQR